MGAKGSIYLLAVGILSEVYSMFTSAYFANLEQVCTITFSRLGSSNRIEVLTQHKTAAFDLFITSIGSGGTFLGTSKYLKSKNNKIKCKKYSQTTE